MSEIEFEIMNASDFKPLFGRYWPAPKPVAMLSLVHGLGEHCGRYDVMAAALNARGLSVCAIDLHGHGNTPGKRGVCRAGELMLSDVTALLEKAKALAPNAPHFLFGHSMGGGLVLDYALSHPDVALDGIIAQAPLIGIVDGPSGGLKSVMKIIRKLAPDFAVKAKLDGSKVSTLPQEQKKYEEDPLNHTHLGVGLGLDMIARGDRIAGRATAFPYPLLLTHGTNDVLTSFEASKVFASQVPQCHFIAYPDSAHEIHNDFCRDQVHADLADWILNRATD